jgi:hypothetical protein
VSGDVVGRHRRVLMHELFGGNIDEAQRSGDYEERYRNPATLAGLLVELSLANCYFG